MATTSYNFAKVTNHAEGIFTLIQGKSSLGCFYASGLMDSGYLLGLGQTKLSFGMIKLVTGPPISSPWDYYWHDNIFIPHFQKYFDVASAGGALFTIGDQGGQLLITRTHLDNFGDPLSDDAYFYSEAGDSLRNIDILIKSYNQMCGLFTGNIQTFIMTVTFHDPSQPSTSPIAGFLNIQKTLIVQPVFNTAHIKVGILENMPTGSTTQEFYIAGMKVGTDSCKATFPSAGAGYISYSKQNENCGQNTQLSTSPTSTQPLTASVVFQKTSIPTVFGHTVITVPFIFLRSGLTATNIPVSKLYLVEPACCNTLQNTPVNAEVLKIGFQPLLIPVPFFTFSELCIEPAFGFTYSITKVTKNSVAIPVVPSFFVLDTATLASQSKIIVKVTTTSLSDIGTYVLTLKGELPNHQSLTLPIQVLVVSDSIIPSMIPDMIYIIGQPQVAQYNSFFLSTNPLLVRLYSIYQDGNIGYDPSIFTYTEINSTSFLISIYSQNDTKPGLYRMEIRAKYSLHSPYEVKSSFQILILDRCKASQVLSSPIKNITITVDRVPINPLLIVSFPLWTNSIGGACSLAIKYQLKMQNGDNLPSSMRFQKQNMKLIINYMNKLTVKSGIYHLTLKGSNNYNQWAQLDFSVIIICFTQSLTPPKQSYYLTYDIESGAQLFKLPQFTQSPIECEDEVSYAAFLFPSFESLPDFISFYRDINLEKLVFVVNAYQNDQRITSGMIIKIIIVGNITLQSGNLATAQQELQIRFDDKQQKKLDQNRIFAKISKITPTGQVTILFNKDMKAPQNLTSINQSSLEIDLVNSENQPISNIKLNWTVLSFEQRFLKIQLQFNNTSFVSNQNPWDKLTIQVKDSEIFKSQLILQNKFQIIQLPQDFFMSSLIPPQIDQNSLFVQFVEKNGKTVMIVLAMNQIIFYILSLSLQMLWGMINSLQLVLLLPLVNIWFPQNAQLLFKMLLQVFNFEFFDSIKLLKYLMPVFLQEEVFGESNTTTNFAFNEQFELNGYSSISSVLNLGPMFFYAIGILIINLTLILVNFILRLCKSKLRVVDYLNRQVFHNLLIRFLIESYIQIIICAQINFARIQVQGDLGLSISSIFALLILALGLLIILKSILIHRLLLKLDNSQQQLEAFSCFFESQKHPFPFAIDYTTWYLVRRFIYATIIVQLTYYPSLQLILLTIQGIVTLTYLWTVCPFKDPLSNKMEIFNESCLLLAIINLYAFVRGDEEAEMKLCAGWFIIGIVALQLAANTVVMFCVSIKEGWLRLKRVIQKCKNKRETDLRELPNIESANNQTIQIIQQSVKQAGQANQLEESPQIQQESFKQYKAIQQFSTDFEANAIPQYSNNQQKQMDFLSLKPVSLFGSPLKNQKHFSNKQKLENLQTTSLRFNSANEMEMPSRNQLQESQLKHQIQSLNLNMEVQDVQSRIKQGSAIKQTSQLEDNPRKSKIIIIPSFDAQLSQIKKNA